MKHLFELHLERSLYTGREMKRFVTSSARVAAQMQGIYGTDGERFHILPPPVETQLFKPADTLRTSANCSVASCKPTPRGTCCSSASCSTILSSRKRWLLAFKKRSISMKPSASPCLRQLAKPWWL